MQHGIILFVFHFQGLSPQFQQMGIQGNLGMPRPVVRPAQTFSAEKDAEIIRKAMKGAGEWIRVHFMFREESKFLINH